MTTPTLYTLSDECAQMAACILDPQEIHDRWLAYSQLARSAANFREKLLRKLDEYEKQADEMEDDALLLAVRTIRQDIRAL